VLDADATAIAAAECAAGDASALARRRFHHYM